MADDMVIPTPEGYASTRRVEIGKSNGGGRVYHFVRRGRTVLFRGTGDECNAFVANGLRTIKKKPAAKKKAAAKKKPAAKKK